MAGPAFFYAAGKLQHRPLPHPVAEPVGPGRDQHRRQEAVLPVIIMRKTPKRSLDAADDHRHIGKQLLENLGIDRDRIVGTGSGLALRSIGIVVPEPLGRGIVVDHRVHSPGIQAEIQPRSAQLAEIPQVIPPVRLRHHSHPVAPFLQPAGNHRRPEGRMVDEGVAREKDHVYVIPSQSLHLLYRGRKHIIIVHPSSI